MKTNIDAKIAARELIVYYEEFQSAQVKWTPTLKEMLKTLNIIRVSKPYFKRLLDILERVVENDYTSLLIR